MMPATVQPAMIGVCEDEDEDEVEGDTVLDGDKEVKAGT